MPLFTVVAAAVEPVSLDELRAQCRIDDDDTTENSLLQTYLTAAREYCEDHTGRHFAEKTLGWVGCFPACLASIELSTDLNVVLSVEYQNTDGDTISLPATDYCVDSVSLYGAVIPLKAWPGTLANHPQPVTIKFTCCQDAISGAAKQAILLLASHWYQFREAVLIGSISSETEFSVHSLLSGSKVVKI